MHSEETKAKIRATLLRQWAEGKYKRTNPKTRESQLRNWDRGIYNHLRKPKPAPEERAAREALRREHIRASVIRQHAEGRGNSAGILSPAARRKAGEALKTSPRAIALRKFMVKIRKVRARARKMRSSSIFDEGKVAEAIVRWQRTGDEKILATIIEGCLKLIDFMIRKYSFTSLSELPEVRNEVVLKLTRTLLAKFDPGRGRCYTFLFLSIKHFLFNRFDKTFRFRRRFVLTENGELPELPDNSGEPEKKLESTEFLERLVALLHPQGWQWRWRWQVSGKLPLPEWQPEWKWRLQGKIAA
jgi:hypothetical protein